MAKRTRLEAAMLQSSLDCIIAIDHEGRILEFNPAAERTFGRRRADVLGQEMAELIVPERLRERHRAGLNRYKATGDARVLDRPIEMVAMRADGTEFPVELTITRVAGQGSPVFTGYLRDITDRKRIDRRRATELAVTRVLAQASTTEEAKLGILQAVMTSLGWDAGAIWMVDDTGDALRCLDFLGSRTTPVAAFQKETRARSMTRGVGLPGRVWATAQPIWIPDVVGEPNFPRGAVAAADGLHSAFGFPVLLHSEVVGVVEFFSHRIEEPDPDLLELMGVIGGHVGQFIERRRAETALRDADRRKDEFLAMLAHELRNPLAPIVSALAILKRSDQEPHIVAQSRDVLERQVRMLVRLVDDLLDMSRLTLNKIELRRSPVSLDAIIERAIEANAPLAQAADQRLVVRAPAEPVWLQADLERMAQVVSNLVNNAIKYTPPGGHITVSGERVGDEALINVQDDGVGIPRHMLLRVFDLFTQIGDARQRSRGGLGIGLTVVKNLVELHGGRVSVQSEGANLGSTFTISIPIGADVTESVDNTPAAARGAVSPGRRVVIVDDNRDTAESLGSLLTLMGHQVRTAYDGPTALEVVREFQPSTVLLDLGLPGMSGYTVAEAIRRLPMGRAIMLVAVTGWGQEEDRRRSLDAGFDHHLIKPADPSVLEALLGSLPSELHSG
jgi:PAS domain S-box-containing protein